MAVGSYRKKLGLTVNIRIEAVGAKHTPSQFLITLLHCTPKLGILQQTLPHGWRRVVATALVAPCLYVGGIGQAAIAQSVVVVPHRTGKELAARTVYTLLLFVEVGTAAVGIGIEAQLGMYEVVNERGHVDVAGIATLRVCKIVGLYDLLHSVHIILYVGHLLWLQILFLRVYARPNNFARHRTFAYAGQLRGEGGILVVESINA